MNIYAHYSRLVYKVDALWDKIVQRYPEHIVCTHGCTDCCKQDLTVLPLEYAFLRESAQEVLLQKKQVVEPLMQHNESKSCTLLHKGGCLLYSARPIICRTHGLPLVIHENGKEVRDCCPKNFTRLPLENIPDTDLLQLETLNTILITLNNAFCTQERFDPAKRIPISDLFRASPDEQRL